MATNPPKKSDPPITNQSRRALALSITALVVMLGLIGAMWTYPAALQSAGLADKVWYVVLCMLGFFCAVSLFSVLKSYASYSGKAMNGTLKLGGPGVLMLVVVALGYALPPKPGKLDLTVFLRLEGNSTQEVFQGARLQLDLGADRREEAVESKGLVRFMGIPAELKGQSAPVSLLQTPLLELSAGSSAKLALTQEAVYLDVRWKPWPLQGQVQNENGTALVAATVTMAGQATVTDSVGHFSLALGSQLAPEQRVLEVRMPGYALWRNSVATATANVQVQLLKAP
ncbi:hypothetical protein os1_18900 [Comamonadaceae bacterium OS-1]|nr:hypothetical protein os1_18900 [Comamonadaceae bacterium OS-1]